MKPADKLGRYSTGYYPGKSTDMKMPDYKKGISISFGSGSLQGAMGRDTIRLGNSEN